MAITAYSAKQTVRNKMENSPVMSEIGLPCVLCIMPEVDAGVIKHRLFTSFERKLNAVHFLKQIMV